MHNKKPVLFDPFGNIHAFLSFKLQLNIANFQNQISFEAEVMYSLTENQRD